jgi:flavin reductase (DIM6/NTAB) family NADH-FMN oxidoreductase RutF
VKVGDHTLFVGEVDAAVARDAAPLVYHRGRYGRFDEDR